jgi:hypothetical protein
MPAPGRIIATCLALALCNAGAAYAATVEKEPVSGALIEVPGARDATGTAPDQAPAPAAPAAAPTVAATPDRGKQADDTSWGVLARGGYFGLPNVIADKLFVQHPKVSGSTYGGEIRYHGEGGGRGIASIGFAVDSATTKGSGIWQPKENDQPKAFSGKIDMLAFSVTGYWSMFPSWYVHPYVGLGFGVAHFKGDWQKDTRLTTVDYWIPVVHLPVGLAFEFGPHVQLSAEARFLDGFAGGGALQVRF